MWKRLSSKVILKHPRLTVVEDEVELLDGTKTDYLRYKNNGNAAIIICKRKDGKLLLQEDYSYPSNKRLIQFPGGWVPKGEQPKVGAKREFVEETGFLPEGLELMGEYLINHRRTDSKMYVFKAKGVKKGKQKLDKEEAGIKNVWLTENEFLNLIKRGLIESHHTLASWALYREV